MIDLWVEGHKAQSSSSGASFCGSYDVETLMDAVIQYRDSIDDDHSRDCIDICRLTFWGCRFFDNEQDARYSFG